MIQLLHGLPDNVLGARVTGKVTDADYEQVLVPAVREKLDKHKKIRFIYVIDDDFDGWSLGAMWEDAKLGLKNPTAYEKIAIVSDKDWVEHTVKALGWMIPGDVKDFDLDDLDDARKWASS